MTGLIIKNISNDYTVLSNNIEYICKPRGKFRNINTTPLVGDIVDFDEKNNYIINIHKRKNELIRPLVANIDIAVIVTSVKKPNFDSYLLDKTLTIITYNNISPIIYFTKLDLLNEIELKEIEKIIKYYKNVGYIIATTTDELLNYTKNKIVVLTGQSGAGKSSLLNKINPNLKLNTNEISDALGRGKHTTRHTQLYNINGTFIVDTPGFSKIDLTNMTNIEIRDNMKEMFTNLDKCKYKDCMHIKEDNCEVKTLVEQNIILKSRYNNYKSFIERK